MKKTFIVFCLIQFVAISSLFGQTWKFRSGEEDWGDTLYASQKSIAGETLTVFTEKGNYQPNLLISPYQSAYGDSFTVDITIDGGKAHRLRGSRSDYFGDVQVEGVTIKMLKNMAAGKNVIIIINKSEALRFGLEGSSKALNRLGRKL